MASMKSLHVAINAHHAKYIIITHMFISGGVIIFLIVDCVQLIHLLLFSKINFSIMYPKIKVLLV